MGHEPILPVPPVQQGDALGGQSAIVKVFPIELDIVAHPLTVAESDGAVIGIAVNMVTSIKLLDILELIPVDLFRSIHRQADIIKEERIDLRQRKLVHVVYFVSLCIYIVEGLQFLLGQGHFRPHAIVKQVEHVDLPRVSIQAGEELVMEVAVGLAIVSRHFSVEKVIVEVSQLLLGEGLGGQTVRPVTELVGENVESAVRLRLHCDLCPDLFPGTGGIH